MSDSELNHLLQDTGLIRNRLKIYSIRKNALALLALEAKGIDLTNFIWSFVEQQTQLNRYACQAEVPTQTEASQAMSKALKKAGFSFVGPTICYAFMQSMGLVNDHFINCPQHPDNLLRD